MLLLALSCTPDPVPAAAESRSAELAVRAGIVGQDALRIATLAQDMEGWMDEWRAATTPEERRAIEARIAERARLVQTEAEALQGKVAGIEAGARAWGQSP